MAVTKALSAAVFSVVAFVRAVAAAVILAKAAEWVDFAVARAVFVVLANLRLATESAVALSFSALDFLGSPTIAFAFASAALAVDSALLELVVAFVRAVFAEARALSAFVFVVVAVVKVVAAAAALVVAVV